MKSLVLNYFNTKVVPNNATNKANLVSPEPASDRKQLLVYFQFQLFILIFIKTYLVL